MNIYVGNLSFQTADDKLRSIAEPFAQVSRCEVIRDRDTGQSRGFAFLEVSDAATGQKVMAELNGKTIDGRTLKASEALPKQKPQRAYTNGSGYEDSYRGGSLNRH